MPGQGQADTSGRTPDVPMRLEDLDQSRFAPSIIADDSDFYERLDAVLSETFQYGPHFRTIQRVLVDTVTRAYLVDIEMDEALWKSGREEGYVSCPPLFDGGLQVFLFNLLKWADLFARAAASRGRDVHPAAECAAHHLPRDEARRGLARRERKGPALGAPRRTLRRQHQLLTTARPGTSSPASTSTPTSPPTRAGTTCRTAST